MLIFALLYEVISLNAYDGVELKDKTRQRRHIKVKNIDLWKQLVLFFEDVRFNLVKGKGHSGLDFNEMADRIATQSIRGDK